MLLHGFLNTFDKDLILKIMRVKLAYAKLGVHVCNHIRLSLPPLSIYNGAAVELPRVFCLLQLLHVDTNPVVHFSTTLSELYTEEFSSLTFGLFIVANT